MQSEKSTNTISLDKVSKLDKHNQLKKRFLFFKDNLFYYTVLKLTEQGTKILEIRCDQQQNYKEESKTDEIARLPGKLDNGFSVNLKLQGVAISIIDSRPQELLYARVEQLDLSFSQSI